MNSREELDFRFVAFPGKNAVHSESFIAPGYTTCEISVEGSIKPKLSKKYRLCAHCFPHVRKGASYRRTS